MSGWSAFYKTSSGTGTIKSSATVCQEILNEMRKVGHDMDGNGVLLVTTIMTLFVVPVGSFRSHRPSRSRSTYTTNPPRPASPGTGT